MGTSSDTERCGFFGRHFSSGDGTLNEVMSGVLATGYDVPIGIIPTGSTNDFGYSLKLEGDPVRLASIVLEAILKDNEFKCDVATFKPDNDKSGKKNITYTAAFGLFSDVSYATPQKLKNTFGHLAYIMYGAKNILKTSKSWSGSVATILKRSYRKYWHMITQQELFFGIARKERTAAASLPHSYLRYWVWIGK